jgi:hypothetical protein
MRDLESWAEARSRAELREPFTYVVDEDGVLRLAPRRSEHIDCAGGSDVPAAGEIGFTPNSAGWAVREVSNHSSGYRV